jgi:hypothetical protein|tara:strand:+ start:592 stop:813 length:222 start_codon:yes stop_codon:yes gene_type:complete
MEEEVTALIEKQISLNRQIIELVEDKINMTRAMRVIRDVSNRVSDEGVEAARLRGAIKAISREAGKSLAGAEQ